MPLAVQYFVEEQLVSPGGYRRAVTAHDASKALGKDAGCLGATAKGWTPSAGSPVAAAPEGPGSRSLLPVLVRRREARAAGAEKAALEKAENEARAAAQRAGDAERAQAEEQRLRTEAERERIDAEKARAGAGRLAAFLGVVAVAALIALGIAVFFFFDAKHHRDVNLELAEKASKLHRGREPGDRGGKPGRDQAIIISKENEALTADAKKQAEALAHTIGQKVEQAGKTDALTKDLLDARQEADGLFSYIEKELIPQVSETGALRLIENLKAQIAKYEANHPSQEQGKGWRIFVKATARSRECGDTSPRRSKSFSVPWKFVSGTPKGTLEMRHYMTPSRPATNASGRRKRSRARRKRLRPASGRVLRFASVFAPLIRPMRRRNDAEPNVSIF